MNPTSISRVIQNNSSRPAYSSVSSTRNFGTRMNGSGLEVQMVGAVYPPYFVVTPNPYSPYVYFSQPITYYPTYFAQPSRNYANFSAPKPKNSKIQSINSEIQQYGRDTTSVEENEASSKSIDEMSVEEIYRTISKHLRSFPRARLSSFNKLLVKVSTPQDFSRALDTLEIFTQRIIEISPETGTLFIKAACRAGLPEKALKILKATDKVRIWPTLGGIHYLMINFSLKKDTSSVKETFEVAKKRNLKPNMRTYQILIRECVDNNLIDDAVKFCNECEDQGIIPNRVTYNILMNGLRKANRAKDILSFREKMDKNGLEINDTTVKFTSIAYMMLSDVPRAITEFLNYPEVKEKLTDFSMKFFEVAEENDVDQKKCVVALFDALSKSGTKLPDAVSEKLASLKLSLG
jgi:pentatricopeptide repeat protein